MSDLTQRILTHIIQGPSLTEDELLDISGVVFGLLKAVEVLTTPVSERTPSQELIFKIYEHSTENLFQVEKDHSDLLRALEYLIEGDDLIQDAQDYLGESKESEISKQKFISMLISRITDQQYQDTLFALVNEKDGESEEGELEQKLEGELEQKLEGELEQKLEGELEESTEREKSN